MPNPNALVARVSRVGPTAPAATPPTAAAVAAPERIAIDFEGDRSAVLPPGRRARTWRDMRWSSRAPPTCRPVSRSTLETTVITRVLIPFRARVVTMQTVGENIEVTFIESHARHHLLRSNLDFRDMLNNPRGRPHRRHRASGDGKPRRARDHRRPPAANRRPCGRRLRGSAAVGGEQARHGATLQRHGGAHLRSVPPCRHPASRSSFPMTAATPARTRCAACAPAGHRGGADPIFGGLHPATSNHPDCAVGWWYHVAPTLLVNTTGGHREARHRPVADERSRASENDWRTRQADPAATFEYTDQRPFWPHNGGERRRFADQPVPAGETPLAAGPRQRLRRAALRLSDREAAAVHRRPQHLRPGRGHGDAGQRQPGGDPRGVVHHPRRLHAAGARHHRGDADHAALDQARRSTSIRCRRRWRSGRRRCRWRIRCT